MRWPRTANQVAKEQQLGGRGREHPSMPTVTPEVEQLRAENARLAEQLERETKRADRAEWRRAEDRRR